MSLEQKEWSIARDDLVYSITSLGFPEELGNEIAKNLGSPKAIRRMTSYLCQTHPKSAEEIVDEMLAIKRLMPGENEKKLRMLMPDIMRCAITDCLILENRNPFYVYINS